MGAEGDAPVALQEAEHCSLGGGGGCTCVVVESTF